MRWEIYSGENIVGDIELLPYKSIYDVLYYETDLNKILLDDEMERKARISINDEANNIEMSHRLEDAGCQILYGLGDYKVHSKLCLITKKKGDGFEYITQIGTGNYNEKTSRLYTDLSLITANQEIGAR